MKLLSAEQIRMWDEFTIQHESISSLDLMERAAAKCTEWIISSNVHLHSIKIFCGQGNNGGDGLAIARQLIEKKVRPAIYILYLNDNGSADFEANLGRLKQFTSDIYSIRSESDIPHISENDIVIDSLFGSGLNRKLEDIAAALVNHINNSKATVISIDIPSGLLLDKTSKGNAIIKAKSTLTFQSLKQCFLIAENSEYFGEIEVLDISLHPDFISQVETDLYLTTAQDVKEIYQPRNKFSHKGHFGHALIIGGTSGKTGAAIIATEACLRSGAGLTSVHLLSDDYTSINSSCPEAMTLAGDELVKKNLSRFSAIGIGPGLGADDIALHITTLLIENYHGKLVLDADALNVLSQNKALLHQLPTGSVLTPHPKEFDRLFGEHENEFARIETALFQSEKLNCIIVLKGHYSLIVAEGKGYFNTTGNAGLAKGGSGDALTGIITSLLAQGYSSQNAAISGVYLHGLAADIAIESESYESLLASDVCNSLGKAFKKLSNVNE